MKKVLLVACISIILAALSQTRSHYSQITCTYQKKDKLFFSIMAVLMICFVGLRTRYNDTTAYINIYEGINIDQGLFQNIDWRLGSNPGFFCILSVLKLIHFSTQSFIMLFSAFILAVYLWFIRKYTRNILFSFILFFAVGGFCFTLAAIKQCTAVALCLLATDRAIEKKRFPFILYILLAATIHPYALMYLVVPFLRFRPWSNKTVFMIIGFILLGFFLQRLMGTLLSITSLLGEQYNDESFIGEGVNPFRLAVMSVPLVISFFAKNYLEKYGDSKDYLFINLAILNACIMFVGLFGTANYFARLANYFAIFQCLALPCVFAAIEVKSRRKLAICATLCYFAFFVYENGINEHFDVHYDSVTIWEYLNNIFV